MYTYAPCWTSSVPLRPVPLYAVPSMMSRVLFIDAFWPVIISVP